jgi:hypothetical protein
MHKLLHFVLYHSRNQLCLLVATWQRHMTPRVAHNFQPWHLHLPDLQFPFLHWKCTTPCPPLNDILLTLSHTHFTHWDLAFSLPEGLVVSFAYLTPPIKVSILSFENRVLFAEEFFVDISRISLQNLSWVSTCILTLYYEESKYIAFWVETIIWPWGQRSRSHEGHYGTRHTALWSCTHIPNIIHLSQKTKMLWPGQENTI